MLKLDPSKITSANSLCGWIAMTAVGVALVPSDRTTQFIAVGMAFVAFGGFVYTTPDRGEFVKRSTIAKLSPNDPITPVALAEAARKPAQKPATPVDLSMSLGGTETGFFGPRGK